MHTPLDYTAGLTRSYERLCCLRHTTSPVCAPINMNCRTAGRQAGRQAATQDNHLFLCVHTLLTHCMWGAVGEIIPLHDVCDDRGKQSCAAPCKPSSCGLRLGRLQLLDVCCIHMLRQRCASSDAARHLLPSAA